MHKRKSNNQEHGLKLEPENPFYIDPFTKVREIFKSEIKTFKIIGKTKEEVKERFYQRFNELENQYGKGFVQASMRSMLNNRDESGNIIEWIFTGEFECFIPEKYKEEDELR